MNHTQQYSEVISIVAKTKNIKHLMQAELKRQGERGTSRRSDEKKHSGRAEKIHSDQTMTTYLQATSGFGDYLKSIGLNKISLHEAKPYVASYIDSLPSAFTQKTFRSALARVFHCTGADLCAAKTRRAQDIRRGRSRDTARACEIEHLYPESVEILRSCGGRHSELNQLTPEHLRLDGDKVYWSVVGKGGRYREVMLIPGKGADIVQKYMEVWIASGRKKIVSEKSGKTIAKGVSLVADLPKDTNVHGYRADFAVRCYFFAIRNGMSSGAIYRSRTFEKDFDKGCLSFVSSQLGHGSRRYYTVITNYLSYGRA